MALLNFSQSGRERLYCIITGSLLICLLATPLLLFGQPAPVISDSLRGEQLLARGLELRNNDSFKKSNGYLQKAAAIFKQSGYPVRAAHCYNYISSNWRVADKNDSARVYAHIALELTAAYPEQVQEKIRAYVNLGMIEATHARYNNSLELLQKAYDLTDSSGVSPYLKSNVLGSLGYLYDDLGAYDEALLYYEKSLDILAKMANPPKGRMAKLYNNIGFTYKNKGFYTRAMEFFKKELEFQLQVKSETHPAIAIAHVNLGASHYRRGDYGQALLHFQKALEISMIAYGEEHQITYISLENIALCHIEMGDYEHAIAKLNRATEIKKRALPPGHPDLAYTFKNISEAYSRKGNIRQALSYSKRALNIQYKSLGGHHPKLIDTYNLTGTYFADQHQPDSALYYLARAKNLVLSSLNPRHPVLVNTYAAMAKAYESMSQYEKADAFYHKALGILVNDADSMAVSPDLGIGAFRYPVYAVDILFDKARMLNAAFHYKSELTLLEASLSTFQILSRLLDDMQTGYVNERSKLTIGRKSHKIYEHAIQTAYDLYQQTKDPVYLKQVFFFAEKSKARVLLESVVQNRTHAYSGVPDSVIAYEQSLKERVNALWDEMDFFIASASVEKQRLSALRDSLILLNRQLAQFRNSLSRDFPGYYTFKFDSRIPSVDVIQDRLANSRFTAVEYFLGTRSLFVIVITEDNLTVKKLAFDPGLSDAIHAFARAVTQRADSSYYVLGVSLYNTLIKPIETFISSSSKLLIIPDGVMALLPFEALLTRNVTAGSSNYRKFPYLLWDYSMAYAPSLALSTALLAEQNQSYETEFLALAPGFDTGAPVWKDQTGFINRSEWNALPFSRLEVTNIAALFKKNTRFWEHLFGTQRTRLFLNENASESALKSTSLDARYIHMATHAFISNDQSELSGIVLYPDMSRSEDGILFAHEIFNLSIKADLVVLSACETGTGSVVRGEGIMSLSRAFQFAGAGNLLVSLWKVEDRSSAKLMVGFYRELIHNKDNTTALQEAKKELIRNRTFAHPYYWAPFILIGN